MRVAVYRGTTVFHTIVDIIRTAEIEYTEEYENKTIYMATLMIKETLKRKISKKSISNIS